MRNRPVYHLHRFDPAWGFATETRLVKSEPNSHERSTASISAASLADG
jgi:hypothetical protein